MKLNRSKKAVELTLSKVISFALLAIVLFVLSTQSISIFQGTEGGIDRIAEAKCEQQAESGAIFGSCKVKICDIESCEEEEELVYASLREAVLGKDCEVEGECSYFEKQVAEALDKEENINTRYGSDSPISVDLSSSKSIGEFAQDNDIEEAKLLAFLEVESSANPFDSEGHPTVRFECHKFNNNPVSDKMPCTIEPGVGFSKIASETNKEAFLVAMEINEDYAIRSSSFGLGQVMGFNYREAGFYNPKDYYEAMFDEDKQVLAFLNFISVYRGGKILKELQNIDTNWVEIARNYNGPKYAENNYDVRLEEAYERFS